MVERMAVVIDYQNMHLTASELFLPGRPLEEGLIEPFRFAKQLAKARNTDGCHEVDVARVEVYRGLPIRDDDADAYRRNLEQKSRWERGHSGSVAVTLRPLKYRWDWIDGVKTPVRSSRREKGVDVMCALALMRLARSGQFDVVVLASRDTDLAPALDEAVSLHAAKIEAAKWYDRSDRRTYGNIKTAARIWTTSMLREHFTASLDPFDYT
ncbi:NYN domain-containing protein [Schaalia sp. 19OD2882]|uniref:NYN domain-containing protein n=1 Tax=Schaalia sp. 19OD2882 TaxID=2794089 RepID=UPI001C1F0192|nr:NYN domain-containing protein [Schaalia sp. 19OD2882]QWW19623.1 NYN domain-containing protein [Schaalia sp. 19OD2882]